MNDIFLSYASEDRERAQVLADTFESHGFSVWWDREIPPGKSFDQVIEAELNSARCVVVLWSEHSVKSRWVKTEAAAAADRNCLVPILIDDVPIPFEFRRIQTARLARWGSPAADAGFPLILDAIRDTVSKAKGSVYAPQEVQRPQQMAYSFADRKGRKGIAALAVVAVVLIAAFVIVKGWNTSSGTAVGTPDGTTGSLPPAESVPPLPADLPKGAIPIRIGDRIGDGMPVAGAGSIEDPFAQDVYVFTANPRQNVFFRMVEVGSGMGQIPWVLTDELGMEIFRRCLGCGQPGVHTLVRGGTYTLRVGSTDDPATGIYSLQLIPVPQPDRFEISIGDVVGEDVPGRGAGIIETPGVLDVYTFTAAARQRIFLRIREHSPGVGQLTLQLTDENGMPLINQCLGCGQPAVQTLVNGGKYTISVGSKTDPGTGTYAFELGSP